MAVLQDMLAGFATVQTARMTAHTAHTSGRLHPFWQRLSMMTETNLRGAPGTCPECCSADAMIQFFKHLYAGLGRHNASIRTSWGPSLMN